MDFSNNHILHLNNTEITETKIQSILECQISSVPKLCNKECHLFINFSNSISLLQREKCLILHSIQLCNYDSRIYVFKSLELSQ